MLKKLWSRPEQQPEPCVPAGIRVYAVGDIHGRLDLLDMLLEMIDADEADQAPAETHLVFLGDLIDRGPDSAGVVERLRRLAETRDRVHFVMGNHEELFLRTLAGDKRAAPMFCRVGGRETALSYGIAPADYDGYDYDELSAALQEKVPAEHRDFLSGFGNWCEFGNYLFVHAGIRPGVALADQRTGDLRWIRREFLQHRDSFDRVVVHGHSITDDIDLRPNRIGIDTGAFATGRLTAIGLEDTDRWFLVTSGPESESDIDSVD